MRYRLRTLLIVLAIGPPIIAGSYWTYWAYRRGTMTELERTLEEYSRELEEAVRRDNARGADKYNSG